MAVAGQQIQTVISVAACRHIDVPAGHAHADIALPADMIPVEGMRRVPVIYREIPDESKGLGIVGGASGGFQPPCFPAHVIQGNEGKHRVDPGFLVQDIGRVTGTAPVFELLILVFVGPFPGPGCCRKIRFVLRNQIQLDQETDNARGAGLRIHAAGAVIVV